MNGRSYRSPINSRVPVDLVGGDGVPALPEIRMLPCHKKNPELGEKQVYFAKRIFVEQEDARTFKDGEEVFDPVTLLIQITLMDWGNAIIQEIQRDGETVVGIKVILNLEGDFKKTEKKITWVADVPESLTPCTLTTFDHLITKDKLEDGDNVADYVNHNSVSKVTALGDVNLREMPVGSIIQFERKGYFRLDKAYDQATGTIGEFFLIPDGKTVNRYGAKA
jgi:glutamyl-tRNA synthetase